MQITILGANSFLARNFIKYLKLKEKKWEINLYDIQTKHIDDIPNYHQVDFSNRCDLEKIKYECDAIYIFIGKTGTLDSFKNFQMHINVNEIILLNILNEFIKQKSKARIVYPSTRLVYAENKKGKIKEEDPKKFNSVYAISKYAAEKYLDLYSRIYNVEYCILRICAPYGSLLEFLGNYGTYEFFVNQAKKDGRITVFGDGEVYKTYTYIEEICLAFEKILYFTECNTAFNMWGESKSLNQIAQQVADNYGAEVVHVDWPDEYKQVDGGTTVLDSRKIESLIRRIT